MLLDERLSLYPYRQTCPYSGLDLLRSLRLVSKLCRLPVDTFCFSDLPTTNQCWHKASAVLIGDVEVEWRKIERGALVAVDGEHGRFY